MAYRYGEEKVFQENGKNISYCLYNGLFLWIIDMGIQRQPDVMNCPVCHNIISDEDYKSTYFSSYSELTYKLYRCSVCLLEFWTPLKIITEFYENETFEGYSKFHKGRMEIPFWQKPFFKHFPFKGGRLLDIGCGDGVFLRKARELGFEVHGLDFDAKSIEIARNKFGLDQVFNAGIEEFFSQAQQKDLKFDVITFFEVLEHQDNPNAFMECVKSMLKEGGYIAGSVPNRDRVMVEYERKNNTGDHPPHHFLWFSTDALRLFLEGKGFCQISFSPGMRDFRDFVTWPWRKLRKLPFFPANLPCPVDVVFCAVVNILFSPLVLALMVATHLSGGERLYFHARLK